MLSTEHGEVHTHLVRRKAHPQAISLLTNAAASPVGYAITADVLKRVRADLDAGKTLRHIAGDLGVEQRRLEKQLWIAGFSSKRKPVDKALVAQRFMAGYTLTELCITWGVNIHTMRDWLRSQGVSLPRGRKVRKHSEEERQAIVDTYLSGLSAAKTAGKLGTSANVVKNILEQENIQRRVHPRQIHDPIVGRLGRLDAIDAVRRVAQGWSFSDIAEQCELPREDVRAWLEQRGWREAA